MKIQASNSSTQAPVKPAFRRYWSIGLIMTGLAVCVLPLDTQLAQPDNFRGLPGDLKRFVHLSEIFAHGFGVIIVSVGIWLLVAEKRRFIPRIVMCAIWPSAGVHLAKAMFGRYRPIKYYDEKSQANLPADFAETWLGWLPNNAINTGYASQSFPSAHTATVWGLAIGMAWVFPKGRWLFFTIAALASLQRVTSFAHWPSDVLFGAAIGFVMAGAITENWGFGFFLGRFENRQSQPVQIAQINEPERRKAA